MNTERGFAAFLIIAIIVGVTLLGGVAYFGARNYSPRPPRSFDFARDADTSNWQTYRNEKYGFEIQYPLVSQLQKYSSSRWLAVEGEPCISFGTEASRSGGYIWGLCIYDMAEFDSEMSISQIGNQFPDRKQRRIRETISGLDVLSVITTSDSNIDWFSKHVFISHATKTYEFSNGAENNPEFDTFLSTFKFKE